MAAHSGPDLVQDGLLIYIDAANSKSYPGSGTNAVDLSGNGYNGTLKNGTTFSTDNGNATWRFDGTDDQVNVDTQPGYPSTVDDPFTIESAIYVPTGTNWWSDNGSSGTTLVSRGNYSGSLGFRRYSTSNIGWWIRPSGTSRQVNYTADFDRWYILTGTFDGTNNSDGMVFYVNGVSVGTQTVSDSLSTSFDNSSWLMGGGGAFGGINGGHAGGDIPYLRVYNRALTSAEAVQNFNATRGRFGL
jgi:hypothetical protein